MRNFFQPATGPTWLGQTLASVRLALGDIWPAPLRLKDYATADLPEAADFAQGLVYNLTTLRVTYSNGSAWIELQPYDATLGGLAALALAQGDLIYGTGADTAAVLAKNATASRYLSNSGTSNNPAWAQVDLTNGVTGALPVANGGTGVTSTAFTIYTPTITTDGGAFTLAPATGRYLAIGKLVFWEVVITMTTVGTATGGVYASLPSTAAAFPFTAMGREDTAGGFAVTAEILASDNKVRFIKVDNTTPIIGGGRIACSGFYEAA